METKINSLNINQSIEFVEPYKISEFNYAYSDIPILNPNLMAALISCFYENLKDIEIVFFQYSDSEVNQLKVYETHTFSFSTYSKEQILEFISDIRDKYMLSKYAAFAQRYLIRDSSEHFIGIYEDADQLAKFYYKPFLSNTLKKTFLPDFAISVVVK